MTDKKPNSSANQENVNLPHDRIVVLSDFLQRTLACALLQRENTNIEVAQSTLIDLLNGPHGLLVDTWAIEYGLKLPFRQKDARPKIKQNLRQAYRRLEDISEVLILQNADPIVSIRGINPLYAKTLREYAPGGPAIYDILGARLNRVHYKKVNQS